MSNQETNAQANTHTAPEPIALVTEKAPQHPLAPLFENVLSLKADKNYSKADDICWDVLALYGMQNGEKFSKAAIKDLAAQVPDEDKVAVSHFLYELALSYEVRKNVLLDQGIEQDKFLARKLKLLFLATELNEDFPLAAARLAGESIQVVPAQLDRIKYIIELPNVFKETPEKSLNELRENCLERLMKAFNAPPFELLEEHFTGDLPLNEEWIVRQKMSESDPKLFMITELTWVLSDCAKLSVNIANYYRFYEPDNRSLLHQYQDFTRLFAGTLLGIFDIPRDISGAITAIEKKHENFGNRKKNVVSALTNLGSIAEGEDRDVAKKWFGLALFLEPGNMYAQKRLEVLESRPKNDWRVTTNLINSLESTPSVKNTAVKDWSALFEQHAVRFLHREVVDSIGRESLVERSSELREVAIEFGRQARVIFAEGKERAESFLKHVEQNADSNWEIAYEPKGNYTVQSQISLVQLLIERKLLEPSINTSKLIEKLEEIRESSRESLELPQVDDQHALFRKVVDLVREDLKKRR